MSQCPVLLVSGVKSRDPREAGGRLGRLGKIFVAFEAYGNAYFRFSMGMGRIGRGGRPDYSQNMPPAAHGHVLAKSDLGGHAEREFDFGALSERGAGEEEDSTRTKVLGESNAFHGGPGLTKRERKKVREPLSDTAFNSNGRVGHSGVTSFVESPKSAGVTLAHGGQ